MIERKKKHIYVKDNLKLTTRELSSFYWFQMVSSFAFYLFVFSEQLITAIEL